MSLISWFYDGQYDKYYITVDETVVHKCDTEKDRDLFIGELNLRHKKVENSEFAKQCEREERYLKRAEEYVNGLKRGMREASDLSQYQDVDWEREKQNRFNVIKNKND